MRSTRLVAVLSVVLLAGVCAAMGRSVNLAPWPQWQVYARHFVQDDGRVVDHSAAGRSTSEGQAYALFFALVADDRDRFDRILEWTAANLSGGDLTARLPGWSWGQAKDGTWKLLDENAASDADLWLAYTLGEAARLWCEPAYAILGSGLADRILEQEVADLPGLGPIVLPGPRGFRLDEGTWRLNPSYLPLQVLRRLAETHLDRSWGDVAENARTLLLDAASDGVARDWVRWVAGKGVQPDGDGAPGGSYDAVRVYLWAALGSERDPDRKPLLKRLTALERAWRITGRLPERLVAGTPAGAKDPEAPPGFYAVLAAWLKATGDVEGTERVRARLDSTRREGLYGAPARYYDQNLAMFAEGWMDERFRFMSDGRLEPRWERRCEPR